MAYMVVDIVEIVGAVAFEELFDVVGAVEETVVSRRDPVEVNIVVAVAVVFVVDVDVDIGAAVDVGKRCLSQANAAPRPTIQR